ACRRRCSSSSARSWSRATSFSCRAPRTRSTWASRASTARCPSSTLRAPRTAGSRRSRRSPRASRRARRPSRSSRPTTRPAPCTPRRRSRPSRAWRTRAAYVAFKHDGELSEIREGVLKQARSRLSASYPIQIALANAIQARAPHLPELRRKLKERGELVVKRVAETENLTLAAPQGAFYALVGIPKNPWATDKEWVLNLLQEEKVL